MVPEKAAMTGIFGLKQPDLINNKLDNSVIMAAQNLNDKPRAANQYQNQEINKNISNSYFDFEADKQQKNAGSEDNNQKTDRTFGKYCQTCKSGREDYISDFIQVCGEGIQHQEPDTEKNKQVKPRVNNSRFKIEKG